MKRNCESDSSDSGGEGSSSGIRKKQKYGQHYKEDWEQNSEFKGWLTKSAKGKSYAKCKVCDKEINITSGKDALIKHSSSKYHKKNSQNIAKQPLMSTFLGESFSAKTKLDQSVKAGEIRLCAFIAEHHLPFAVMDHLVKTIGNICTDSEIAKRLACGRTKSTAIINNVLGPHGFQSLIAHLQKNKFSLIADESTDIGTVKHLCLVVRRVVNYNVSDDFLTLIKLSAADATTMYNHIVTFFETHKIPYKQNLLGFASDGANVMVGEHHSLVSLLKKDISGLYTIKCICHSFHLCASYACQKIPRFVEDLVRDIYNYFASSPKRVSEFETFQNFCNINIHKILHPSQTRWLSVHLAVARILEQYGPLQLYFTDAVSNKDLLATENILKKLNDPTTKLFLLFLEYVLPFFNDLNREMQSEKPKLHQIYKNICNILRTIFECFLKRNYLLSTSLENIDFKNPRNYLEIEDIYFGANILKYISDHNLSKDQLHFFRLRCLEFYIEACNQIVQRFPLKNNLLSKFIFLDPTIVKSGSIQSIVDVAILFPNIISENLLQKLDTEWRLLRNTTEIQLLPDETILFWQKVKDIQSGDGTPMFTISTNFVFTLASSEAHIADHAA